MGIAVEVRAQEHSRLTPLRRSNPPSENLLRPLQDPVQTELSSVPIESQGDSAVNFGLAEVFDGQRIEPLNLNDRSVDLTDRLLTVDSLRTQFKFQARVAGGVPAHDSMTAPLSNHLSDQMVRVVSYLEPGFINPQDEKQPAKQDETKPGDAAKPVDGKPKPDEEKNQDENPLAVNGLTVKDLGDKIDAQIASLKDNTTIDEATKANQMGQLNAAKTLVQQAAADKRLIDEGQAKRDKFEKEKIASTADAEATPVPEKPVADKSSEDLQMELRTKRSDYQSAKEERALIETQIQEHDKRIPLLPGLRSTALNNLKTAKQNRAEFKPQPNDVASAWIMDAKELAAQKRLEALTMETSRQDEVGILLPLKRTSKDKQLKKLETEITDWEAAYNIKRNEEIEDQKEKAEAAYLNADPALKELAEKNQLLISTRSAISTANKLSLEKSKKAKLAYDEVDKKLSDLKSKIDTPNGPSLASGVELVDFRQNLTYSFENQKLINQIDKELEQRRLEAHKLAEDRMALATPEELIDNLWDQKWTEMNPKLKARALEQGKSQAAAENLIASEKTAEDRKFREAASEIIAQRVTYLTTLEKEYKDYQKTLIAHQQELANLMNKVKEAREYIDKKALWLKSASPVSVTDLRKSARAVGAFFDSKQWTELLAHTQVRLTSRPYECALAGFVLFVMIIISRRLRVQI